MRNLFRIFFVIPAWWKRYTRSTVFLTASVPARRFSSRVQSKELLRLANTSKRGQSHYFLVHHQCHTRTAQGFFLFSSLSNLEINGILIAGISFKSGDDITLRTLEFNFHQIILSRCLSSSIDVIGLFSGVSQIKINSANNLKWWDFFPLSLLAVMFSHCAVGRCSPQKRAKLLKVASRTGSVGWEIMLKFSCNIQTGLTSGFRFDTAEPPCVCTVMIS